MENIRSKDCWNTRMQRETSNWRKEWSILVESGTCSDNIKLSMKEIQSKKFQRNSASNRKTKAGSTSKGPKDYKVQKKQCIQNKTFKEDTKNSTDLWE